MSDPLRHGETPSDPLGREARLDRVLTDLLVQLPEIEAAAVVSFDGLAMASALPAGMDEDRVAAMSAALLSLGEKAAAGLGRGDLSQVYVEGESGTVFLVSAQDEAVLVAVAAREAKTGLVLFEIRHAADAVAAVLAHDDPADDPMATTTEIPRISVAATPVAPTVVAAPATATAPPPAFPPPTLPTPPTPTTWPPAGYGTDPEPPDPYAPTTFPPTASSAVVLPGTTPATAAGLAAGLAGAPSELSWSPAPLDDMPPDPWAR